MKKIVFVLLSLLVIVSLSACGEVEKSTKELSATDTTTENNKLVEVDENLLDVEVILDRSFFDDISDDEIRASAEKNGIKSCKINDDDTVTYVMSKKKHKELLADTKASADKTIDGYLSGENKVNSFVDIKVNDDYSKFDVYVDGNLYTSFDGIYSLSFYMIGAYYQAFNGVSNDDIDIEVNYIDNSTKEVLDTATYKEFLENDDSSN